MKIIYLCLVLALTSCTHSTANRDISSTGTWELSNHSLAIFYEKLNRDINRSFEENKELHYNLYLPNQSVDVNLKFDKHNSVWPDYSLRYRINNKYCEYGNCNDDYKYYKEHIDHQEIFFELVTKSIFDILNWNIFNMGPASVRFKDEVETYSKHIITAHQNENFGLSHLLSLKGYIIDFDHPSYSSTRQLRINSNNLKSLRKHRSVVKLMNRSNQGLNGRALVQNSLDILNLDLRLKACAIKYFNTHTVDLYFLDNGVTCDNGVFGPKILHKSQFKNCKASRTSSDKPLFERMYATLRFSDKKKLFENNVDRCLKDTNIAR